MDDSTGVKLLLFGSAVVLVLRPRDIPRYSHGLGYVIGRCVAALRTAREFVLKSSENSAFSEYKEQVDKGLASVNDLRAHLRGEFRSASPLVSRAKVKLDRKPPTETSSSPSTFQHSSHSIPGSNQYAPRQSLSGEKGVSGAELVAKSITEAALAKKHPGLFAQDEPQKK